MSQKVLIIAEPLAGLRSVFPHSQRLTMYRIGSARKG
jgi:hypothetical protein